MTSETSLSEDRYEARRIRRRRAYPYEALGVYALYGLFRVLPLDMASGLGGWIGRTFGPRLKSSRTAFRNLNLVLPELSPEQHAAIVRGMWDNLGRTMAEYPYLKSFVDGSASKRVEIVGGHIPLSFSQAQKPYISVSAHTGNWEIVPVAGRKLGIESAVVFRTPNNPWVDRLLQRLRRASVRHQIPKGNAGLRDLVRILREGGNIGLLVDQKMNTGISVPFFGHPAMTAPAAATLADKFDCPIIPVRTERIEGARFRVTFYPPLERSHTGDPQADAVTTMTRINALLEEWIRERPEQWLWMHRRWPESGRKGKY